MYIDGKAMAVEILAQLKEAVVLLPVAPRLAVLTCSPNFETQKFLTLKQRRAQEAGIDIQVVELDDTVSLAEVAAMVSTLALTCDGLIIQFPFPHLATEDLIPLIPVTHDVDVMQYQGGLDTLLPPVVGAIHVISEAHSIVWENAQVVVVGNGRLVGAPAALYACACGARVTVVTKDSKNLEVTKDADIIILGAGVPNLLIASMVKPGVVVFDAGTSEEGGLLVGDAAREVADVVALITPVPGGIGPITIAILLRNLIILQSRK